MMLFRGANAVGYTNYPDNVVQEFIRQSAKSGIDVFRVFDSLNWLPNVDASIEEVLRQGKVAEGYICYTGDISDPTKDKYNLNYYVNLAKEMERRGVHVLGIKDMAGLCKPYAAQKLVTTLKQEIGLPIHFHTHDTSGNGVAAALKAAEAGVDIVDGAIASLSSITSQPSMNAIVTSLAGTERDTGLDDEKLLPISDYWNQVRGLYAAFEADLTSPATDIYKYEIPGGQYSNLKPQVENLGLGHRFKDVKEKYKEANDILGDIVKVTPSSKMVGDLAIFMVQNDLDAGNIVEKGKGLSFPDSVVSYFEGMMGQPQGGFPKDLQAVVLKGKKPITCRPGELLAPADFDQLKKEIAPFCPDATMQDVVSYCMYPKVFEDFQKFIQEYSDLTAMDTPVFFHGLMPGEVTQVEIADGKTLFIKLVSISEPDADSLCNVVFELNGIRRELSVLDRSKGGTQKVIAMADTADPLQIGASIQGMVSRVNVKPGEMVKENQVIAVIEAMKMETIVVSRVVGVIDEIFVQVGQPVKAGELIVRMK